MKTHSWKKAEWYEIWKGDEPCSYLGKKKWNTVEECEKALIKLHLLGHDNLSIIKNIQRRVIQDQSYFKKIPKEWFGDYRLLKFTSRGKQMTYWIKNNDIQTVKCVPFQMIRIWSKISNLETELEVWPSYLDKFPGRHTKRVKQMLQRLLEKAYAAT